MVSIILPCYKSEDVIGAMIEDVIAQTYKQWELIIVSNGEGQQQQLDVISKYAETDDRIRVVSVPEGGVSNARNIGMSVARGEWITFVDADDRISPTHLQTYIDTTGDDVDIVCGGYEIYRINEKISDQFKLKGLNSNSDGLQKVLLYLLRNVDAVVAATWNKLYSSKVLEDVNFDTRISFSEDRIFNLEVMNRCHCINVIPMSGYRYMVNTSSASGKYHPSFDLSSDKCLVLESDLRCRIGLRRIDVDRWSLETLYIRTYFKICNMFRPNCKLSFAEKVQTIRVYLADGDVYRSFKLQNKNKHNMLLRLFDFSLMSHSPRFIAFSFAVQYFVKSHLGSVQGRILRKMRENKY